MKTNTLTAIGFLAVVCSITTAQDARHIVNASGVHGGLVVLIGCDTPTLLAELRAGDSYLVHGLEHDPEKVAAARSYLRERGLYGAVTVSRWDGSQLPFVDSLVNVLVMRDAGCEWRDKGHEIRDEEIMRVLAPGGVCLIRGSWGGIGDPASRNSHLASRIASGWTVLKKPVPPEIDQWSHFLYDASNNAVSGDRVVSPPHGLRWTCGPEYARSHEHFASMSAMVSAGGRIFYIIDEGPISSVHLPPQWKLVARDAFSGVLLWQRPITNWESQLRGFRSGPPEIGRRMVATDDWVYAALGYGGPVTVLDAATGKEVAMYASTNGARELLLKDGALYVLADDMSVEQHEARKQRIDQVSPGLEIWYRYPREAIPMYGTQRIIAIGSEDRSHACQSVDSATDSPPSASGPPPSGDGRYARQGVGVEHDSPPSGDGGYRLLWKRDFDASGEILPATMAIDGGRLCLQTISHVVCLDAVSGKQVWRSARPVARSRLSWSTPTLVIHDGVVLSLDRTATDNVGKSPPARGSEWIISSGGFEERQDAELVAFSLDDGKELWRAAYSENYNTPGDVLVIDGVVWVGNLRGGHDPGFTEGRELRTGKVTATIPPQKAWGHHRCYRNKATVNWLMVGRGGVPFIDPRSGAVHADSWYRGECQYGVMPANGLVYVPQHSCACQPEELLIGLNALAPQSSAGEGSPPLEKGPAYDEPLAANLQPPASGLQPTHDWPTYRCDVRRSGYQDLAAPPKPGVAWITRLSTPITAPVVAGGLVFVAETDLHTLHALSAADGMPAWTFVADGRIDSPPTLSGGRCLFGTRSGFVYCLQAVDGSLIWRFRAAPQDRRLFAYEQLESAWPVHGSVLVEESRSHARQSVNREEDSPPSGDGSYEGRSVAYFAAGRSARLDGGIRLYALDVETGERLHKADVKVAGSQGPGIIRQSVLPDILSLQKDTVWMRRLGVDKNLAPVDDQAHLFAPPGFLDDTWWHRTYWVYGAAVAGGYQGWPLAGNAMPAGRLLVFDGGESIYGYGRMAYREGGGHVGLQAASDYRLFAEALTPKPQTREDPRGEKRQVPGRREIRWTTQVPFVVRSMVLTRDALLLAGDESPAKNAANRGPGVFWVASRDDGSKAFAGVLPAPPVLDGMALTDYGVFVSMIDGGVTCLRADLP